ncbi:MAG: amino acid adenylation domain-containing protein [Timaviella obliquedivisa GSE-PSE-MK23-08B]|jgi:amino acid adenylation domain-containing protein/thioester reductase-like protein|nr:amino acid adenylation domain-containing protein [Timaviella obliquedivisa GSE-PSE-MK23-08B]
MGTCDLGQEPLAVHQYFEAQVAHTADAIALEFADQQLTYQTLNERSNQLAHYLQALKLQPNSRIGLCLERSPEMIVALLAILKIGAAYVPLDASYPSERLAYMLENAQVSVLLTQSQLVKTLPTQDRQVICVDADREAIAAHSSQNLDVEVTPNQLAYVIYTSGSTGQPKGVMMPHRALVNLIAWQRQDSTVHTGRSLQFSPISFDVSFQEIFSTLAAGGTLVLIPDETRRDPQSLLKFLDDAAIERLFLPFIALQQLAEVAKVKSIVPKHLCEVITAGEALRITDAIAHWFTALTHCTLSNQYGPSESHVVTAYTLTGHPKTWSLLPAIGKPIPNTQIYLLDEQLQPVPSGAPGEVYIGGVCLAQGYLNRPDLTSDRFITNPHTANPHTTDQETRLYKTGDLARYLPDGNLEYLGRIDQQVKIRGFRIEPGEIESVLEQHPDIREAVVAAREDVPGDKRLVAYIVTADNDSADNDGAADNSAADNSADNVRNLAQTLTAKELRQFLKSRLPEYMVPSRFVYVDRFPLTPSGKVDRLSLLKDHPVVPVPSQRLGAEIASPQTDTEVLLTQIWGDVLGLEAIGIDDNFLELGGHSLLAVQVLSRIHDALQVELPLRHLFEAPTIRSLAQVVEAAHQDTTPSPRVLLKPLDRNGHLPLASVQEPLWFLDQLVPHHPFYSVPEAFRLTGQINVAALEQSLQEIVKRHEVLRSTFEIAEGKPVQVVHLAPNLRLLRVVDLRDSDPDQRESEAWQWINKEAKIPFNLAKDLLLRATLYRLEDSESILFLNQHHIICDGWSISILLQELSLLYATFAAGHDSPLPALSVQYADFAVWQRQWLRDEVRSQQLNYWKQQLGGDLPILQLPSDRLRPHVLTYQGARHFLSLPSALTQKLKDLSRQEGATLFMTLLAAFQALLARYSGQTDIRVGSLVANRHRSELETMLGFFANTLVLRTDVSGAPNFRELLHRVQAVTLAAYSNQDVPFEEVVQALQPDRTLTQNPLFQVLFNLQNTPTSGWTAPLALTRLDLDNQTAKFDLFLELAETPEGLKGYFEYSTDLFDATTIARMAEHFHNLLAGVIANADQRLARIGILSAAERQQIEAWNDTATEIPLLGVHQLFEAQAERTPHAIAVQYAEQQLTYQALNQQANQLAHHLQAIGVKPDTLVGLCLTRSLDLVVGLLGILKAGRAYVPLDPAYPQARIAFMLEDSQVAVLVTERSLLKTLPPTAAQIVCLDDNCDRATNESSNDRSSDNCSFDNPISQITAEHLAYTIYTSGSTGKPKGVQISHRALTNLLHSMGQEPGLTAQDILLSVTTICFDIAALEIYLPLVVGACVVIASREATMDARQLADLIEQSGTTVMQATPATWRLLLAAGWQGNSRLKILCGGEALPRELADQLLVRSQSLWNMYGPTETTIWSAVHQVQPGDKPVPLGRAIANTQLYLLNPHHPETGAIEPVPIGVPGEICIGGLGLARGYLNRDELTQERFIPNPLRSFLPPSSLRNLESVYKTGDLARYLPDGSIEYMGRVDHQVKIRGFRIELGDIESTICQHSAVRETVVLAREDTPGDSRLVAYVVMRSPDTQSLPYQQQTQQWQKIWDAAYSQSFSGQDATFNISGWNNSYTRSLTAAEEMQEWVDHTVTRILSLHPQRVLEIGCGTGLLLFRIAPHCEHYLGIDPSETAIKHIREHLILNEQWFHVQLDNRAADTLDHLKINAFDTVIINSVVQYFPSIEYLVKVLEQTLKQLNPGGSIFIGDVRSLPLLQAFHTSIQLYQAADDLAIADLQERIRERVAHESELLIDPTFFTDLKQRLPAIDRVEIQLKRGHCHNELTRFRYDVILHIGTQSTSTPSPNILSHEHILPDWQWQPDFTVSAIHQLLETKQPSCFRLSHIPNSRLSTEIAALQQLKDNSQLDTVGMLRQALQNLPIAAGIDPEDWWQLEQNSPYRVSITWAANQNDGSYDVEFQNTEFQRSCSDRALEVQPPSAESLQPNLQSWQHYANTPFQGTHHFIPELQTLVRAALPDYMMPSAFVVLDALPLTPNGKVDRQALPAPSRERSVSHTFIAPRTPIEKQLNEIWAEILGIAQVGIEDNFFELGGHSLLIAQMVAQVQSAFNVELSLFNVFNTPTIQSLATVIGDRQSGHAANQAHAALDLRAEAVLDPTIFPKGTLEKPAHPPANVLLTGATGFLGAFLLHELLEQTQATVHCLVRAATIEAGAQRLQRNLASYSLWQPDQASRIIPVLGDLSLPLLGLSAEQFRALAATLDSIYHSGGFVNFIYPYSALKAVNVLSSEEILRLAAQVKVKPVHFVSTLGVFSPIAYQNGQIIRQEQPEPSEGLYGYTQSKWVAEKLLAIAQTRGIPSTVYRPAWIEGHSQTGICNSSDFFRSLIKGCIQMGIAPNWRMPVDLTPIDYISQAIVHLSLQNTASEKAFNFSNPHTISWHQLVNWMNKFGYSIQEIPYEQWIAEIKEHIQHQPENALHPFSTFLFEKVTGQQMTIPEIYFQTHSIQFDCQPLVDELASLSAPYPAIDDILLTTYFQQFIHSGFLAPPLA